MGGTSFYKILNSNFLSLLVLEEKSQHFYGFLFISLSEKYENYCRKDLFVNMRLFIYFSIRVQKQ